VQLRLSVAPFFSSRSSGLVGGEEDIILDCYRLAKWFHVNPEIFLSIPLSEVTLHLRRAAQLDREQQATTGDED
jgi:hypothetical protein